MREFRCRLVLETTFEAGDEEEARRTAISEFAHHLVDEGVKDEQVVVSLEDCGSPCSERNKTCKRIEEGESYLGAALNMDLVTFTNKTECKYLEAKWAQQFWL